MTLKDTKSGHKSPYMSKCDAETDISLNIPFRCLFRHLVIITFENLIFRNADFLPVG